METVTLLFAIAVLPAIMAQTEQCVSLKDSTTCSAFSSSSVSTDSYMVGLYPFLQSVTDAASFDKNLTSYVNNGYVSLKYQTLFGCHNIDLTNTTDLYARFTTTVICNGVIQNSIDRCDLSEDDAPPVCADTCAQYAISEEKIVADSALCSNPSNYTDTQLRADYTNCGLPSSALNGTNCVEGITNEPSNCGFGNSVIGLCMYCKTGGQNSTDSCCSNSGAATKCAGIALPSISSSLVFTATSSSLLTSQTSLPSASSTAAPIVTVAGNSHGLSAGAIAGIVVGGVVALALIILLLFCLCLRRRRQTQEQTFHHEKVMPVAIQGTQYGSDGSGSSLGPPPSEYEVLPSGRVARRSAPAPTMEQYTIPPIAHPTTLTVDPSEAAHSGSNNEAYENRPASVISSRPASVSVVSSDDVEDLPAGFVSQSRRAPSIAPSEYVILPGGRRVRRSMTITSEDYEQPGSERVISRPASIAGSERGDIVPIPLSRPSSSKTRPLSPGRSRRFSRTRSPRPTPSRENSEYEVLPGGRIARKSALVGYVPSYMGSSEVGSGHNDEQAVIESERQLQTSTDEPRIDHDTLPELHRTLTAGTSIPDETLILERTTSRATTTRSIAHRRSHHSLAPAVPTIPSSVPSQSIEDHYSPATIHPGDTVGVIWSYSAKTRDEFSLERGDLLRVVGIWDDGWGTGVMIDDQRADSWQPSGTRPGAGVLQPSTSRTEDGSSGDDEKEIKAFPIICVCRAEYWRKVVEADGTPVE